MITSSFSSTLLSARAAGRRVRTLLCVATAATAATLAAPFARAQDDWAPNLNFTTTWHDNATHADLDADQIGALQTSLEILSTRRFAFGQGDALHATGRFAAEFWPRYDSLTRYAAGARGEWRHHFGTGPLAPVVALSGGADWIAAHEGGRRGVTTVLGAALRKRFNDRWRGSLSHEFTRHHARFAVFDEAGSVTTLELGRDFSDTSRLTFAVQHRDGDILSYASAPRADLDALASNSRAGDTFDRPVTIYSIDARTFGAKAAFIRAFDEHSAIILAVEYRETEKGSFRFTNRLGSLSFVHQF